MALSRNTLKSTLAGAGLILCSAAAAGVSFPCGTQGCAVYAAYSILGLPVYAWGAAGFALILLASLAGSRLLTPLLLGALLADTLLLAYQSLFWPCTNCLLAAAVIGAICLLHRPCSPGRASTVLFLLWGILFVAVGQQAAKEVLLRPWSLQGNPDAPIQVYFSPTCQACRDLVQDVLSSSAADRAAFIPVAKSEEDEFRIAVFLRQSNKDLLALFEPSASDEPLGLQERLRLLRNKAKLASLGRSSVPVLIAPQLPNKTLWPIDLFSKAKKESEQGCSFVENACTGVKGY